MNPQLTAGGAAVLVPETASGSTSGKQFDVNAQGFAEFYILSPAGSTVETFTQQTSNYNTFIAPSGASAVVPNDYQSATIQLVAGTLYPAATGYKYFFAFGANGESASSQGSSSGPFDVVGSSAGSSTAYARVSYLAANQTPSPDPPGIAAYVPDGQGLLTDGQVSDASTGYSGPAGPSFYLAALYDFGTPATITAWELAASVSQGGGGQCVLSGSSDGATWTGIDNVGIPTTEGKHTHLYTGGDPAGGQQTGAPISATFRYFQLASKGGGSPQNVGTITDARLWDSNDRIVLPVQKPQIIAGSTLACAVQGTYTRGRGGWDGGAAGGDTPMGTVVWCIDDSGYADVADSAGNGYGGAGWNAVKVSGQNQLSITVPSSSGVGTSFAAYVATDGTGAAQTYWYVVFDVVTGGSVPGATLVRRRPPMLF